MDLEMDATCKRRIARFYGTNAILKSLQFILTVTKDSLDSIVS